MIAKLREIIGYLDLLWTLIDKDLKIRYQGTVFGYLWSLINPFFMMVIYTVVFSIFLRVQVDNYALYLICALLPWTFFSNSLLVGTTAVVGNAHFISKFYCPRELFPMAVLMSNAIILFLSFFPFVLFLLYIKGMVGWSIVMLPIVVFIHLLFTLGLVLILSSLYVFYRDVRHLMEFVMMIWFYLTPIIYPISMVPEKFRFILYLNPMVPVLSLYRDVLYDLSFPSLSRITVALTIALITFVLGWKVFLSLEGKFVKEL